MPVHPTSRFRLAARGEGRAAFDGRCIPAACVALRSNTPGILGRRALAAGRLAGLGATPDFHHGLLAVVLTTVVAGTACRSAGVEPHAQILQPGAPGESSRVIGVATAVDLSKVAHTAADVRFMQGMIGHHAQAVEMVALVPKRSARNDMRMLALRIDVSQADEITMMRSWLELRGQTPPDPHAHHAPGAALMPGMLSAEEMSRLVEAKGVEFDRLFLEGMIKHHEGALTMVQELFASPGAGQDSEIFAFATDVDADQRMEIDRMSALLQELQK
jgi:uncharacterized protein (DUF305 family)